MALSPEPAWGSPIEILNRGGASPIILICEHASSFIPPRYARLGLSEVEARSHIAWDIGAEAVTRELATLLDAPAFIATHSRLLVDLNRPPHIASAMAVRSEATEVPGNRGLSEVERDQRIAHLFHPFHDAIASFLDERGAHAGAELRILSIHSFTRVYLGERRPWDMGILFDRARDWGAGITSALSAAGDLNVGEQVPYSIGPEWDYAVPVHGDARGIDAVLIEICNDLLQNASGAQAIARRIAAAL